MSTSLSTKDSSPGLSVLISELGVLSDSYDREINLLQACLSEALIHLYLSDDKKALSQIAQRALEEIEGMECYKEGFDECIESITSIAGSNSKSEEPNQLQQTA